MLRTALKPRWLALLVLALVLATGMAWLGQWQLDRARENSRRQSVEAATNRPQVPLTSLLTARQTFTNADADRPVTASGTWDGGHQLLVAERYLAGTRGWWVLTPLVMDDGSAVAVVRGWVGSATDPAAGTGRLAAGDVRIRGVLRPGEPPVDRPPGRGSGLPAGQLDGVDLTQLVQRWPQKLITGYVVLTGQEPAPTGAAPRPVPPTAPSSTTMAWQNLSYALQWFVFAGFLLLLWYRLVRDDHRGRLPSPGRSGAAGDGGDGGGGAGDGGDGDGGAGVPREPAQAAAQARQDGAETGPTTRPPARTPTDEGATP